MVLLEISLLYECLSHDQALSNIQHRPGNDTLISVLYTEVGHEWLDSL